MLSGGGGGGGLTWMAAAMRGQHLVQMWPPWPHVRTSS